MAFNFNWSPLTADASFYTRAQELLTAALNKYPKPPIIVDDIVVNELNLGSVPPDLEILEIGDLAEDRFRGIFKMCYSGDAFLTLKTRVQANPLNTYLSTRPSFASVEPLAAASGLTIPLKLTLSDIKLSAFIILVFSKQKGVTIVFRNDPLESLKVSSTFDSIPFVRDYLQKTIEEQLRSLLMEEVPAIIHRLSLRLWVPEYRAKEDDELAHGNENLDSEEIVTDPLASPPQDPVDLSGHVLDAAQIASLSLDSSAETQSLFSQKNLVRLAALSNSHRTLSLFTPAMQDVVFRAWVGPSERREPTGIQSPIGTALSRKHSHLASTSTTYTFSTASEAGTHPTRPTLTSFGSSFGGGGRIGKGGRKRKHRVVNLRKVKDGSDGTASESSESVSGGMSSAASEAEYTRSLPAALDELQTPPQSPLRNTIRPFPFDDTHLNASPSNSIDLTPRQPRRDREKQKAPEALFEAGPASEEVEPPTSSPPPPHTATIPYRARPRPSRFFQSFQLPPEKASSGPSSSNTSKSSAPNPPPLLAAPFPYIETAPGGILEQAFLLKMASEISRRVQEQKAADSGFWDSSEREAPPPAYGV